MVTSAIAGVALREVPGVADERGCFRETFRARWFGDRVFVQGNASTSAPNVLRGLHYHLGQDDYWVVLGGQVSVALAELRRTEARRVEVHELRPGDALFIPRGVAHGFYAHDHVLLTYLVTAYYDGSDELGVAWDDPDLAIPWPCRAPVLSQRDRQNPRVRDIAPHLLP